MVVSFAFVLIRREWEGWLAGGVADFDHLEAGLGRAAIGAGPVLGDLGPSCTGWNAVLGQSDGLVIREAASEADPAFQGFVGHGDLHWVVEADSTNATRAV